MREDSINTLVSSYGIQQPVITFIRHNENRTYKIDDRVDNKSYLLRIHQPFKENMAGLQHTYDGLLGELEMLEMMASTSHLIAQIPIRNHDGDFITSLEYEGQKLNCSVLTWLQGRDLHKEDLTDAVFVAKLGSQIAELHTFFRQYDLIDPDKRPIQGMQYNAQLVKTIKRGSELKLFTPSDVDVIEDTIRLINSRLENLGNSAAWGLVHGDLNKGNVLVTSDGEMSFIDFGFFGPGYYLLDVAMGASMVPTEHRRVFLEGYYSQSDVPKPNLLLLEGFMLVAIIGYYAFQMDNESVHPWMRERMPVLCEKYCRPFLAGESIFYTV